MKLETDKLIKISNYAREKGMTTQAIYKWIKTGKIRSVDVDGVTFVVVDSLSNDAAREKNSGRHAAVKD